MTTKQYLEQLSVLEKMITDKLDQIYTLRTIATCPSCQINQNKVQTSHDGDKMTDIVAKIIELNKEIETLQDRYTDLRRDICNTANKLSYRHKNIIISRYVYRKTIHAVAVENAMTDRGCKKAHLRALEEFSKAKNNSKLGLDSSPIQIV